MSYHLKRQPSWRVWCVPLIQEPPLQVVEGRDYTIFQVTVPNPRVSLTTFLSFHPGSNWGLLITSQLFYQLNYRSLFFVPKVGLEPTHSKVNAPKAFVSTIPPLRYFGAREQNRTDISTLARWCNNRYTTLAIKRNFPSTLTVVLDFTDGWFPITCYECTIEQGPSQSPSGHVPSL